MLQWSDTVGETISDATQKEFIIKENGVRNGGGVRSDLPVEILYKPQKAGKHNEWQIDHIIPKTKGGSNSYANAQFFPRFENRMKSDDDSGGD
ncbi:HNH endonuclease signature motif containing protein [Streptococcus infantis]|uniref:HNH endonuclease signature motif containing protein n=1 Tax=Streptococcus infantis TaxID=68892 RepID=UPI0039C1B38B